MTDELSEEDLQRVHKSPVPEVTRSHLLALRKLQKKSAERGDS